MFLYHYFVCQFCDVILSNSSISGFDGIDARVSINFEKLGGVVDGKDQDPIFNGAIPANNNSPETVIPKFSKNTKSVAVKYGVNSLLTDIPPNPLIVRVFGDFKIKLPATFTELPMVARSTINRPFVVYLSEFTHQPLSF